MCCEVIRYFLCFIGYFFWFVRCWPYLARYFACFITYPFFKFSICFNSQPFSIHVKWKFLFCWSQRFCMDHSIGPPHFGLFSGVVKQYSVTDLKFFCFYCSYRDVSFTFFCAILMFFLRFLSVVEITGKSSSIGSAVIHKKNLCFLAKIINGRWAK